MISLDRFVSLEKRNKEENHVSQIDFEALINIIGYYKTERALVLSVL